MTLPCTSLGITCVLPSQEMAGRALKQTGSRSIEAALEYISKMGYLDPRNEQIVRVIKQTSPGEPRLAPLCVERICNSNTDQCAGRRPLGAVRSRRPSVHCPWP